MPEENKEKIKKLELDLKTAFKEEKFDETKKLAEELKALDPENHLAERLLEKIKKIEADKLKKDNAEKIKDLEKQLKQALKDGHEPHIRSLIEEIKTLDPENKAIKKVQAQLDKEKAKLEAQANKEKVKGLITEIKVLLKNEEWDKTKEKANELLKVDEKNSFASKALKKVAKAKEVKAPAKAEVPKPTKEKKPEAPKKEAVPPVVEKKAAPAVPPVKPVAAPKVEAVKPKPEIAEKPKVKPIAVAPLGAVKKPAAEAVPKPSAEKGNIFTRLFGKKEVIEKPEKSIIDTIVAKTEKVEKVEKKKKEEGIGEGFLKFASTFFKFSVAFILISAGFFYVQNIDEQNRFLPLIGIEENNASRLHKANEALEKEKEEERALSRELERYKEGYDDKNIKTINSIVEKRLDWPDLIRKLNEVTEFVYERNVLAQYVQYNNYSYDVSRAQLTVNGTLSDPLGKNLTKLAELEEAFRYYPKDKDDPTDIREPYFYGLQEFRSYSKTFNRATGRYQSNFSLTLYTKETEE